MKPEVTPEQALDILDGVVRKEAQIGLAHRVGPEVAKPKMDLWFAALDALRARLTDYDALKRMLQDPDLQDVLNLREERDTLKTQLAEALANNYSVQWQTEKNLREKAEAEVERLSPYEETYKHYEQENSELRAALALAKPLIELIGKLRISTLPFPGSELVPWPDKQMVDERDREALSDAVVAYRAAVQNAAKEKKNG